MKMILPILADIANGWFAILGVSYYFGIEPLWWYFLIGSLLAMSPDIDALSELLTRGKVSASSEHISDHRTFLHYPIFSIPLAVVASYAFGYWGAVFFVALLLHLVNDLYGTGWGLALLYPFSKNRFKFFAPEFKNTIPGEDTIKLTASWSPEELNTTIKEHGVDDWIDAVYLTVNPTSVIEYSLFLTGLIFMLISLLY